jgi:DNA-binding transcriptional LysR family regulator
MFDPRSVEAFYWVVRLGGFGRAAAKLNTTQPAISQRIAQLEAVAGKRLIDRAYGRTPTPTPAGTELLAYAERLLALEAEMRAALADPATLRGLVRLGVSETIVHTWLSHLVRLLHASHPGVTLEISVDVSERLQAGLDSGELDVALLLARADCPAPAIPLCEYPIAWIASPDLELSDQPTLEEVACWPVITYARQTHPYRQVAELFAQVGIRRPQFFANASVATIVRMVQDGIGVGVVARAVVAEDLAAGRLRELRGLPPLSPLSYVACYTAPPEGGLGRMVAMLAQEAAQRSVP